MSDFMDQVNRRIEALLPGEMPSPEEDDEDVILGFVETLFDAFHGGFMETECLINDMIEKHSPGVLLLEAIAAQWGSMIDTLTESMDSVMEVIDKEHGGVTETFIRYRPDCPSCSGTASHPQEAAHNQPTPSDS
jgi:hypothetical protein